MLNSTEKGDSSDGDGSNLERNEAPVAVEQHVEEEPERREDEYIDEEKYTTVTVEPMEESQGGEESDASDEAEGKDGAEASKAGNDERDAKDTVVPKKRIWTKKPQHGKPRKRRKKFRYETKIERKAGRSKQKAKNTAAAKARREYAPSKR